MKRFFVLLALLLLVASPALAANRVIDDADVLSASDENALEQAIAAVSQEYNFDIIILTKTSIDGRTATYYAADYYDDHGFGYGDTRDGVMVLLVTGAGVGNRDMGIISHGRGEKIFDLDAIYALEDDVLPYLRLSNYSSGMAQFVMSVRDRLIDWSTLATKRVIDDAGILSATDVNTLEQAIAAVRQEHNFDIIILTKTSIDGYTATDYASDYYKAHDFGYGDTKDGIMILLVTSAAVGIRDTFIAGFGRGVTTFSDPVVLSIKEIVTPDLRQSNYSSGLTDFVNCINLSLKVNQSTLVNVSNKLNQYLGDILGLYSSAEEIEK